MSWGVLGPMAQSQRPSRDNLRETVVDLQPAFPWVISSTHPIHRCGNSFFHGQLNLYYRQNAKGLFVLAKEDDAQCFHEAYLADGPALARHLEADFAAVFFNSKTQQLQAFTDPAGVKQLYYSLVNNHFYYAFDLPSLLAILPHKAPWRKDKALAFLHSSDAPSDATFYEGVSRLLPGQVLNWRPNAELRMGVEHPLLYESPQNFSKDSDWVEAFHECFMRAVQSRCQKPTTGCMLSGGLDSSSIVGAALYQRKSQLQTLSCRFPHIPKSDEGEYIEAMVEYGNIKANMVDLQYVDPLANMGPWLESMAEPHLFVNFYMEYACLQKAQEVGLSRLLDGMDGDIVVSHGVELPMLYFRQGRLGSMWDALKALGDTFGYSPSRLFNRLVLKPLLPVKLMAWRQRHKSHEPPEWEHFFWEKPLNECELDSPLVTPHPSYNGEHALTILDLSNNKIMEAMQSMARPFGLEIAYPFFDGNLLQLCLHLPPQMKIQHHSTRYVMRAAMKGYIPEKVRLRNCKSNVGFHLHNSLLQENHLLIANNLRQAHPFLREILNMDKLLEYWMQCQQDEKIFRLMHIWPVICLNEWLIKQPTS